MSMAEFFSMGGFGFYIWTSVAATVLLMLIEVVMLKRHHQQVVSRLKRIQRMNQENS